MNPDEISKILQSVLQKYVGQSYETSTQELQDYEKHVYYFLHKKGEQFHVIAAGFVGSNITLGDNYTKGKAIDPFGHFFGFSTDAPIYLLPVSSVTDSMILEGESFLLDYAKDPTGEIREVFNKSADEEADVNFAHVLNDTVLPQITYTIFKGEVKSYAELLQ